MYKSGKYCAVFTALLLVVGLAGCENPAKGKPAAVVNESGGESAESEAASTETANMEAESAEAEVESQFLAFTENTTVGFVGSKVVSGSHTGGFETITGGVTVMGEDLTKAKIDVTIDMASTWTDADGLTKHLKNADFFDIEKFPESKFTSTAITKTEDGYSISGDLTLHGVTKNITFPAQMSLTDSVLKATSEFTLIRGDFGIDYGSVGDNLIRNEVVITLDIEAAATA